MIIQDEGGGGGRVRGRGVGRSKEKEIERVKMGKKSQEGRRKVEEQMDSQLARKAA